ncbi:MAG: hypothetical protein H0U74_20935 [Bradymonadaceae bacterium]|nr:hypothetical protein [Lujinxingiaceae bacterium]
MAPRRGILLIGEVYGRPNDALWNPKRVLDELRQLRSLMLERILQDPAWRGRELGVGYAIVVRDTERSDLPAIAAIDPLSLITRDELPHVACRLSDIMDYHAASAGIDFASFGAALIDAVRDIGADSYGQLGDFLVPEDIYDAPELPTWLR